MNQRIKTILKEFLDKQHLIPNEFWHTVLWLQENETLGFIRNGRIVWKDDQGKHEGNWQIFLRKCHSHWNENEILQRLKDYQLFFKRDTLTAREVLNCRNVEIRHRLLTKFGPERFFKELGGIIEHQDGDSQLIIINLGKNVEPMKVVKVRDATTKQFYFLRVPLSIRSCREAIAWTFGLTADEYNPIQET
jgi:hypothetical protein